MNARYHKSIVESQRKWIGALAGALLACIFVIIVDCGITDAPRAEKKQEIILPTPSPTPIGITIPLKDFCNGQFEKDKEYCFEHYPNGITPWTQCMQQADDRKENCLEGK